MIALAPTCLGVLDHQLKRILTGALTEFGVDRDVAADDGLQAADERADDRAGADGDAAHDPQGGHRPVTGQLERGGGERRIDRHVCLLTALAQKLFESGSALRYGKRERAAAC